MMGMIMMKGLDSGAAALWMRVIGVVIYWEFLLEM